MTGIMQLKRLFGGVEMKNSITLQYDLEDKTLVINFSKGFIPFYINLDMPDTQLAIKIDMAQYDNSNKIAFVGTSDNDDYEKNNGMSWYFDPDDLDGDYGYITITLNNLDAEHIMDADDIEVLSCLCFDFIGHLEE